MITSFLFFKTNSNKIKVKISSHIHLLNTMFTVQVNIRSRWTCVHTFTYWTQRSQFRWTYVQSERVFTRSLIEHNVHSSGELNMLCMNVSFCKKNPWTCFPSSRKTCSSERCVQRSPERVFTWTHVHCQKKVGERWTLFEFFNFFENFLIFLKNFLIFLKIF